MSQWASSVDHVRKQLDELKSTLNQNEKFVHSHREAIMDARGKIEQLLDASSGARETLYQLPLVFGALASTKLIGSLILGSDGQVVMHNFTAQRLLPMDPGTGKLSLCTFFDPATGKQLPEQELPWHMCLQGRNVPPVVRMKMRHPNVEGEVHMELGMVPLRKGPGTSGVVVLFIDATEPIKVDQYIKNLCQNLDQQVTSIEDAHRDLQILADTMGVQSWTEESKKPVALPPKAPAKPLDTNRVLLVDDIPVNQKLLVMQLRLLGVQTDQAVNGLEAVALCEKQDYALVLMDCDMPILNGFEATERIRAHEKKTGKHVPIVAMTSYDRAGDREMCLCSGMDDYLFKGVGKARLQEIVDRYVFGRQTDPAITAAMESADKDSSGFRIDMTALADKFGDGAEKIVALFFSSGTTLLNCLEFAIQDKDADGVQHFAHSLKGPGATIGLSFLVRTTGALAADAEAGRWDEAADQLRTLKVVFHQLKTQAGSLGQPIV